jgi:hypothetical protein
MIGLDLGLWRGQAASIAYDTDAATFFSAAGISDTTQKSAVNQLVLDLKSASIWTKMLALYPFVGGTATTHKYNLKDPRDLDAAFRVVWAGGVTHSSDGVTGNGSNGYGDTKLTPSVSQSLNDAHLSIYNRTNAVSNYDIGARSATPTTFAQIGFTTNGVWYTINQGNEPTTTIARYDGLFIASRTASNIIRGFQNSTRLSNLTNASSALPTSPHFLLARSISGSAAGYSSHNLAFASIGAGLSDAEAGNFYTAVMAFQTTLGRNV